MNGHGGRGHPYRVEIVYASYDDHSRCYFYGIRVMDTDANRELTTTITRHRFREFLEMHHDLDNEIDLGPAMHALPSKYFGTSPERRRPQLEKYLNELVDLSLPMITAKKKLPRSLQKFLGLADDALTAVPIDQMTFDEYDSKMLNSRNAMEVKDEVAKRILGLTVTTGVTVKVLKDVHLHYSSDVPAYILALVLIAQVSLAVYVFFVFLPHRAREERRREFTARCSKLKSKSLASLGVDVNAPVSEDKWITAEERENLPKLRQRLVDFVTAAGEEGEENAKLSAYDETFLAQYGKTCEGLLQLGDSNRAHAQLMRNMRENRLVVWNKNVAVDHRLAVFLRYNGNSLDRAESQARFALTVRSALRQDFIFEDFRPPPKVFRYAASPMLIELTKEPRLQIAERISRWWLRDRDGNLCTFTRMGAVPSGTMFEVGLKRDADMLNRALIWFVEVFRLDMDTLHVETKGAIPAQCTVVVDMAGFDLASQLATSDVLTIVKKYVPLISPGYGGLLKRFVVINAPWYVNMLLNIVKPFIPKDILDSVRIYRGYDKKQMIDPFIEDKYVPQYLGGSLVGENGDRFCRDRLSPFGPFEPDQGMSILKSEE